MLFNSGTFLFVFLPITTLGFWVLGRGSFGRKERAWLVLASLVFYGWWDPRNVVLILASIALNYSVGNKLRDYTPGRPTAARILLTAGIAANLGALAYFKYMDFLRTTSNTLLDTHLPLLHIALPLGISFFTFEQIAFLVDTYRTGGAPHEPLDYAFFVLFFPRVIAGPILRASEMFPQLERRIHRALPSDAVLGITIFILGLAKKVLIADAIAPAANAVFSAAGAGAPVHLFEAWGGALAYTAQLYFDFSGYSDMAIGLALLFGIRLPMNFASPYKATSIVDFWRRWHMTLSRFLRDYLYIPLGGSRLGRGRRYTNLMLTMLLGGLWHGASWTFIAWGGFHGICLVINHMWSNARRGIVGRDINRWWSRAGARTLTLLAVIVGWVVFRAPTWSASAAMFEGMAGLHGISIPQRLAPIVARIFRVHPRAEGLGSFGDLSTACLVGAALAVALLAPNTEQLTARWRPVLERIAPATIQWRPTLAAGLLMGATFFFALLAVFRTAPSEFLYYRF